MLTQALKQRVTDAVANYIKIANDHYKPAVPFRMPRVVFDKRGTTAGTADYKAWEVDFNAVLLLENTEKFMARTVPHEVAHLIDFSINDKDNVARRARYAQAVLNYRLLGGRRPRREKRDIHGASWNAVMTVFGVDDSTRCHSYDTETAWVRKKEIKRFMYGCMCPGKTLNVGPKHHKKIQSGFHNLRTKCCKYKLREADYQAARVVREAAVNNAAAPRVQDTTATPPPPKTMKAGSKLDYAVQVLGTHDKMSRSDFISIMIRDQNMSKAGAQTYYYSALKVLQKPYNVV